MTLDWGEARLDLSILDIDEDFLQNTCPRSYKEERLDEICPIPDEKDFMILTTHKIP